MRRPLILPLGLQHTVTDGYSACGLRMAASSVPDMPGPESGVTAGLGTVVHKMDANDDANDDVVVQSPKTIAACLDELRDDADELRHRWVAGFHIIEQGDVCQTSARRLVASMASTMR